MKARQFEWPTRSCGNPRADQRVLVCGHLRPQLRLAEAVALVLGSGDPIVLRGESGAVEGSGMQRKEEERAVEGSGSP